MINSNLNQLWINQSWNMWKLNKTKNSTLLSSSPPPPSSLIYPFLNKYNKNSNHKDLSSVQEYSTISEVVKKITQIPTQREWSQHSYPTQKECLYGVHPNESSIFKKENGNCPLFQNINTKKKTPNEVCPLLTQPKGNGHEIRTPLTHKINIDTEKKTTTDIKTLQHYNTTTLQHQKTHALRDVNIFMAVKMFRKFCKK